MALVPVPFAMLQLMSLRKIVRQSILTLVMSFTATATVVARSGLNEPHFYLRSNRPRWFWVGRHSIYLHQMWILLLRVLAMKCPNCKANIGTFTNRHRCRLRAIPRKTKKYSEMTYSEKRAFQSRQGKFFY